MDEGAQSLARLEEESTTAAGRTVPGGAKAPQTYRRTMLKRPPTRLDMKEEDKDELEREKQLRMQEAAGRQNRSAQQQQLDARQVEQERQRQTSTRSRIGLQ